MLLFSGYGPNKLMPISEASFELEKDMQSLTEKSLDVVFGLEFISTEFVLQSFRIDTLAYDAENQSFVIIEYKKGSSWSVIDQGYSYLSLMLNNKAEFTQALSIKMNKVITNKDINWESSRVVFIANSFNQYQKESINFKDLPIELRELKKYDDNLIIYNPLKPRNVLVSVKSIQKQGKEIVQVNKEIKTYAIDDHFTGSKNSQRDLYESLKEKVMQLDSRFEENVQKYYIAFKIGNKNVVYCHIQVNKIILHFARTHPDDVKDPEKKLKYMDKSMERSNQHVSEYILQSFDELGYVIYLVEQVLRLHKY